MRYNSPHSTESVEKPLFVNLQWLYYTDKFLKYLENQNTKKCLTTFSPSSSHIAYP